ncbi:hypothetical protein C8F04DRAFT_1194135 [Mycena alexandri]|uniref:Uncharacterized protein n=1 Tax=Mycena alexandri TaxID=1745969 RepID=A0AAD6S9X6_9AGAR|nr:hypothetical protein C8F04DRAFT_1194135 [Mycena alexandri]
MSKGRQPGAKNKPGHSAEGARSGAGRKPKEREHNPVPDANNERRKRKQPDTRSEADNQHKRHKKAHREEDAGTSTNTDDTELAPSRAHRMGTTASSSTVEKPKKGILDIPEMIPPISNPDILPAGTADSDDSNILPELDDSIFDGIDAERPAEDTPDPEGLVQAYFDRVQKQVTTQLDGIHKQARFYQDGTFWIRPRDTWFALEKEKDSNPEALYYPRVFVWVPSKLVPKDFSFTCIFCGKNRMGESDLQVTQDLPVNFLPLFCRDHGSTKRETLNEPKARACRVEFEAAVSTHPNKYIPEHHKTLRTKFEDRDIGAKWRDVIYCYPQIPHH